MHREPSDERRGVIRSDELYTLSEFKLRLKVTDATLRSARRAGLGVYYVHRHGYIFGDDWFDYVRSAGRRNGESNSDAD
jgi:hypothetical protein